MFASDDEFEPGSPELAPTTTTKKRKSTGTGSTSKKSRTSASNSIIDPEKSALITAVLGNKASYAESTNPQALGDILVDIAGYARDLETALKESQANGSGGAGSSSGGIGKKTKEELEVAADKLSNVVHSGIKKQMSWKPSCKTNSAKFAYDGICTDPEVFGHMLGLSGPPTWKMKKFSKEDFEDKIGRCTASIRYGSLEITSKDVNIRWSDTGEFKITGSYGRGF